jgi:hypothetical protein
MITMDEKCEHLFEIQDTSQRLESPPTSRDAERGEVRLAAVLGRLKTRELDMRRGGELSSGGVVCGDH